MTAPYILAIDGGGTRTRVALARTDGEVVARTEGGFANLTSDYETSLRNIEAVISNVYDVAGLPRESRQQDVAILGIAGADVGNVADRLAAALNFATVRVISDQDIAIVGVLGTEDGTLAHLGTGSFFVSQHEGNLCRIGGWGLQLSDECSGAWLGRELLRQVMRAHDGVIDATDLTREVMARFDEDPSEVVLFATTATPKDFGQMAPEIFAAHDAGDRVAASIIGTAINDLNRIFISLNAAETGRIFLAGGVGERYKPLIGDNFRGLICSAEGNPLSGALALGRGLVKAR